MLQPIFGNPGPLHRAGDGLGVVRVCEPERHLDFADGAFVNPISVGFGQRSIGADGSASAALEVQRHGAQQRHSRRCEVQRDNQTGCRFHEKSQRGSVQPADVVVDGLSVFQLDGDVRVRVRLDRASCGPHKRDRVADGLRKPSRPLRLGNVGVLLRDAYKRIDRLSHETGGYVR